MNSFLMWVGGLLVAVLAALFAVPHFIDWNGYRGVFEEEASRILGRSVRVGGDVNLRLLPSPYVRFDKLRIADSSGLTGEPFFFAESFTMWLSVPPMLKGIMEAERIELDKPVVRLAALQEGVGNWGGFSMQTGSLPFVPSGVALDSVKIVDGVLSFDVEGGGRLGQIERINGELNATSLSGPFSFRGQARRGRSDFNVIVAVSEGDGRGGMRLKVRANKPKGAGVHTFDGRLSGLDGQPKIVGKVTSSLAVKAGRASRGGRSRAGNGVEVTAQLSADSRQAVLSDVTASFDSVGQPQTITGEARVTWGKRHAMVATLSSQWLDLDHFGSSEVFASDGTGDAGNGNGPAGVGGGASDSQTGNSVTGEGVPVDTDAQPVAKAGSGSAMPVAAGRVPPPWKTARALLGGLSELLPSDLDIKARFQLDQARLGGDALSGLRLVMSRNGGPLTIESLQARLPGSGRLEFSGIMKNAAQGGEFSGDVFVGGPSLARFKKWALDEDAGDASASDGSFSISGKLKLGEKSFALRGARAEFSGVLVHGGVSWSGSGKTGRVSVNLSGQELDSSWVGLKRVDFSSLARSLGSGTPVSAKGSEDWNLGGIGEVLIRIKAGKLINGDEVLHNVDAKVSMKGDKMNIPAVSFETPEGLEVEFEGELSSVAKQPSGEIRWVVSARDAGAAKLIETLVGSNSSGEAGGGGDFGEFLASAAPFRVAGKLNLGGRQAKAADIEIDGEVRGGRLVGQLRFDGGLDDWQKKPADITVTLDSPRWRDMLSLLAVGGRIESGPGGVETGRDMPMRGVFKAVGVPLSGMKAMGLAQSEQLTLIYNGSVDVGAGTGTGTGSGGVKVTGGEIVVAAANVGDVLGLMGLPVGGGVETARVDGLVDLEREGNRLVFRPRDLKVGASTVAGRIELRSERDGGQVIDADLVTDSAQMNAMMSALLRSPVLQVRDGVGAAVDGEGLSERPGGLRAPQPAREPGAGGVGATVDLAQAQAGALAAGTRRNEYAFSDSAFDLSMLSRLRGRIVLAVGALSVGPGLVVTGARVETHLKDDKILVALEKGEALGGAVNGRVVLERGRAGVGLTGGFVIENAALSGLTRWDETGAAIAMASGRATMKLDFNGRALSPRGVVSVLSGKGEIALEDGRVKGLSPEIVTKAADEAIARAAVTGGPERDRGRSDRTDLAAALKERLGEGDLELGTRTIGIDIVDGAARLTPFSMKNVHGVTTGRVTIDIGQLAVDSDFKMSASAKGKQAAWPPVDVVFVGPLGKIGAVAPLVSLDALERELVVRKLEQNVSELERLRRLDKEAGERRRARELERARALKAARASAKEEAEALEAPLVATDPADGATSGPASGASTGLGPDAGAGAGTGVDGVNPVLDPEEAKAIEQAKRAARQRARARRLRARKRRPPSSKPARRGPTAGEVLNKQFQ